MRFNVRLVLIVTLVAAAASLVVFGLLLGSLAVGFRQQDETELDSRLLSYWAEWQHGGNEAVLERASRDIKEHGGRPFLFMLYDSEAAMVGGWVPGGWEGFNFEHPSLGMLYPGTYTTLRDDSRDYSLLLTGAVMDDGSRLVLGLSTENREFLLRMYQSNYPLALGAIILAGITVGIIASRRLLAPITRINHEIDRIIVTGELSRRLAGSGHGDQLDGLIERYNRLLDRVESLIAGMRETLDAVAHDLRTPLTRLRGYAELALSSGAADEYEEALGMVVEQTDQVDALLSSLMDIAGAEAGMLHLNPEPCDLRRLAAEVCDMYEFIAEEKSQRLRLDAPFEVPLIGDAVRLRRILGNLVDNAVKYGPQGGSVDVRCRSGEPTAVIEVVDDGPGVPTEDVNRVFDRLYRGDRSRGSRGLGLGLSMVKALAEAHGGRVSIHREEGRGARFRVELDNLSEK